MFRMGRIATFHISINKSAVGQYIMAHHIFVCVISKLCCFNGHTFSELEYPSWFGQTGMLMIAAQLIGLCTENLVFGAYACARFHPTSWALIKLP